MMRILLAIGFLAISTTNSVNAHEGPHHDIERLTTQLAAAPNRADWRIARARAFRLDGQFSKALEDLDLAAASGGEASLIAFERGLTYSADRRDEQAERELTKHLSGSSPRASGYAERAVVRERNGRANEAIDDFSAAIALAPKVEWYCARGRLQKSIGRPADAADGLRNGMAKCNGAVAIRLDLLELETARGRIDVATSLIDDVLPQADVKTEWYLRRAVVQDAGGNADQAAADRAQALAEAERAVARRPTAQRLLMRAKAFVALHQVDNAVVDLRAALRRSPSLVEAKQLLEQLAERPAAETPTPATLP